MSDNREMFLGIKLTRDENDALILLAKSEGLQKSSYARRALRLALRSSAQALPANLLTALNIQQAEILP